MRKNTQIFKFVKINSLAYWRLQVSLSAGNILRKAFVAKKAIRNQETEKANNEE